MKTKTLFVLLFVAVLGSVCFGQSCPTCPPGYYCPPVVQEQQTETSVLNWYQKIFYAPGTQTEANKSELEKYRFRAVRITTGNACGSGSLVGRDSASVYILTNSHVSSNRPGTTVTCEAALKDLSGTEKFKATVIEGAYSSKTTTDWALLKAESKHMAGLEPLKLSIRMPDNSKVALTYGCPRCEVPSGQVLKTVDAGTPWKWLPNSIGGQSGSGVFQRGFQFGLLTWSYGGPGGSVGAGQYTFDIYRQSRLQTTDSPERPEGLLLPVCQDPVDDLIEGYTHLKGEPRLATVGNFQDPQDPQVCIDSGFCIDGFVRQAGVGDYPIWGDPDSDVVPPTDPADPVDPTDPVCPPSGLDAESRKELEAAKKLIDSVLDRGVQDKK